MANIVYMARSAWTGLLDTIRSKAGITGSMTVSQAASAVESIETGGGSNIISGEFTTQSTTGEQNITIPYSGNGYPVRAIFYCENNTALTGSNRCVGVFAFDKTDKTTAPTYIGGSADASHATIFYRYNTTATQRYQYVGSDIKVYDDGSVGTGVNEALIVRNNKTISIQVDTASIGFVPDTVYHYFIEYSS